MTKNKTKSKLSIVMKMSILAGSVTAAASIIIGTVVINGSADIVYQNALNRLKYETNYKSISLISDIKNLNEDAKYLAATPPIKGIPRALANNGTDPFDNSSVETWENRLATIFSELIRAKSNYLQIRYIGLSDGGKELVRIERNGNLIQKIEINKLQQKGNTNYFKKSLKLNPGDVYLSEISLNREFGKISVPHIPVIRAVTPVFFRNQLFGILVINMSFEHIFKNLIKNTPRELTPYVTNENGYFLAHPNKKMTYGFEFNKENTIQALYDNFELNGDKDIRDTEFSIKSNGDVIHVVKAYFDPSSDERFFAVMLATSYKNLQAQSAQLTYNNYILTSLLVIISLIVAALLASRLLKPLRLITQAADDLAQGREVLNLPIKYNDEIGELARSFDDMHHQLKDKESELILSQSRVHYASKMASLGKMAAGMAHEINTPIQTVNLIAERVQRQLKKNMTHEEIDSSMNKILNSVHKVSDIIDSLRKVSRDSKEDPFTNIKVKALLEDSVNMTEERFKVNNVAFKIEYHDISQDTFVQCQGLQISQVIINLINNAYDAIEELNKKWVTIDVYKRSEKLQISITDSGYRMSDDIIDKIFEPLYTSKDIGKGTGLGLSISRDIILNHHGVLYVDKKSENTRFVIEIPFIQE